MMIKIVPIIFVLQRKGFSYGHPKQLSYRCSVNNPDFRPTRCPGRKLPTGAKNTCFESIWLWWVNRLVYGSWKYSRNQQNNYSMWFHNNLICYSCWKFSSNPSSECEIRTECSPWNLISCSMGNSSFTFPQSKWTLQRKRNWKTDISRSAVHGNEMILYPF